VRFWSQIFAEKSQHPGPSHYLIHAYDYPALVDRALATALNFAICVTVVTMRQLDQRAAFRIRYNVCACGHRCAAPVVGG
jgi:hypothetical protein